MMSTRTCVKRFDRVLGGAGDGGDLEIVGSLSIIRDSTARATVESSTIISRMRRRVGRGIRQAVPRSGERPLHVAELRRRRRAEA